ncbi:MAG: hypothetical protein ACP5XB_03660 [Isosphaeraceae bacterium]
MAWSKDRKRFAAALTFFLFWVGTLTLLAVVSSYRPAAQHAPPEPPPGVRETLGVP